MDLLDKISLFTIAVLIVAAANIVVMHADDVLPGKGPGSQQGSIQVYSPGMEKKIKIAKDLFVVNNLDKAEPLIRSMISDFPYEGMPYMLLGDLFMRRQAPLKAMLEYRKGIDMNPDFLDKKTSVFQGKKVKVNLEEVKVEIEKGLAANPGDPEMKGLRKVFYYMQRRVAGSCG